VAIDEDDVRTSPAAGGTGLGLIKGLGVTLKHALRPSITQQYPDEKPDLPPRTRGVIALKEANCTVCWKCSRECPDWCIYIEAHKETHDPASGGKARSVKVLDRFAIDYALCMYCGICVEVCPFDALFWSPEFEYSEYDIVELIHEKEKLEEWTYTVLPPPALEEGAEPVQEVAAPSAAAPPTAPPTPGPTAPAPGPVGVQQAAASAAIERTPEQQTPSVAAAGEQAIAPTVEGPHEERVEVEATTPAPAEAGAEPATSPAPVPPPGAHVDVQPDPETYERVLAEALGQGKDRRVAEGLAKRAGIIEARKKAAEGT
jgi:formate hydrogenlyase subunit 6/NADH:ubiquinone oxidoreductase subunit I